MKKPREPFDLEDMIKWYELNGLDWKTNVKFYFWMKAGQPRNHWTLY